MARPQKKKKVLSYYYILNFVNKKHVEICFLSCYISTYMISSFLPVDSERLEYLLSGLYRKSLIPVLQQSTTAAAFLSSVVILDIRTHFFPSPP